MEVAAYQVADVWRSYQVADGCSHKQTSKQTYGGRMAVVSGCSRMEVAAYQVADLQTDVWRSYGGRI